MKPARGLPFVSVVRTASLNLRFEVEKEKEKEKRKSKHSISQTFTSLDRYSIRECVCSEPSEQRTARWPWTGKAAVKASEKVPEWDLLLTCTGAAALVALAATSATARPCRSAVSMKAAP